MINAKEHNVTTVSQQKDIRSFNNLFAVILEYIWAFLLVMNGNTVYNANALRNYHLLPLCVIATAILLLVFTMLGIIRLRRNTVFIGMFVFYYCLVYAVVKAKQMVLNNYLFLFCIGLPLLLILFTELHHQNKLIPLIYRLENVILGFLILSLVFWFFGTFLHVLKPNMSTEINWGIFNHINGYWGLHFDIQRDTTFGVTIYRNSGMFTEGPMLNLWACIALAIELFLKKNRSKLNIAICIAAILTSMSTTGLLFIGVCVFLLTLGKKGKKSRFRIFLDFTMIFIVIPIMLYALASVMQLKMNTLSFRMRMSDYIDPLRLWAKFPIFGSGYGSLSSLKGYVYSSHGQLGFSNSVIAVLATGGLWMGLLFYIPHIASMFSKVTKDTGISQFCICLFFLFCTTAFFGRYLAVVMIAICFAVMFPPKVQK